MKNVSRFTWERIIVQLKDKLFRLGKLPGGLLFRPVRAGCSTARGPAFAS
jgi:hypothetical protein